jgi:hypothetical protein
MKTLEQLHASRKRWMTRLVRATNEVHKLDKKIHRLNSKPKITEKIGRLVPPKTEPVAQLSEGPALDIPTGLIRKDEPQLVDKLKARRKPVDKTAMPLSGNAAKAYLKEQSEAVTERRKKRKLA